MSLLKSNSVQIGQSATAAQNFTLSVPSSPDGTIKLARGNSGATTADILSVSSSGAVTINNLNNQSFRNRIINGGMRIDQRNAGAAITPTADQRYSIDRWRTNISQASKITFQQQAIGAPQSCDGNRYTLSCITASAYTPTSTDYFGVNQLVEGFNTADLLWGTSAAKTVTLSFWVYSGLTGSFGGAIRTGDSSNYSYPFIYTINSANTWEKKTITILGPTSGTWGTTTGSGLDVWFSLGTGSTYTGTANTWAAANYLNPTGAINMVSTASGSGGAWYITGVQLEAGSTATDFERRPIGTELALCQRYYVRYAGDSQRFYGGRMESTTVAVVAWSLPVEMRTTPTAGNGTIGNITINDGAASAAATSLSTQYSTSKLFAQSLLCGALTNLRSIFISFSSGSYLDASAEL